jgi:hypothetical protein
MDIGHFRRRSRQFRDLTTIVIVGLALVLLLGPLAWLAQIVTHRTDPSARQAFLMADLLAPGLFYLFALWSIRAAFDDLGKGRLFETTVTAALQRVGWSLLAGGLISVFVVTNVARVLTDGRGGYLHFDLPGIVLGVVGAALVLLARLIDQARAIQAELDEMI